MSIEADMKAIDEAVPAYSTEALERGYASNTPIKWYIGAAYRIDGGVDHYGIKDGEFQLLSSSKA